MSLTLIDRSHLMRLLDCARGVLAHSHDVPALATELRAIIAAYDLSGSMPPQSDGQFETLRDASGTPIVDTQELVFNFGDTKIEFFPPNGDWNKIPEGGRQPLRLNNWVLKARIDGKWHTNMSARSVEIPKLDYSSDDVITLKIESYVYANGPSWLPDDRPVDAKEGDGFLAGVLSAPAPETEVAAVTPTAG